MSSRSDYYTLSKNKLSLICAIFSSLHNIFVMLPSSFWSPIITCLPLALLQAFNHYYYVIVFWSICLALSHLYFFIICHLVLTIWIIDASLRMNTVTNSAGVFALFCFVFWGCKNKKRIKFILVRTFHFFHKKKQQKKVFLQELPNECWQKKNDAFPRSPGSTKMSCLLVSM